MAGVSTPVQAAAVSNAGALGSFTATNLEETPTVAATRMDAGAA